MCNRSIGFIHALSEISGIPEDELFINWRGLNHLTFVDGVFNRGRNILPELLAKLEDGHMYDLSVPADLLRRLGFLPNQYLQYYYTRRHKVEWLRAQEKVRSEAVKEIDEALLEQYKGIDAIPEELKKRGGYRYSETVVNIIAGICGNLGSQHFAVVRNGSTLPELPEDAFVEVPVIAHGEGLLPLQTGPLPRAARSLVIAMKDYDRAGIEGAMNRDRKALFEALMIHPLIADYDVAAPLLDDCMALNAEYMPRF